VLSSGGVDTLPNTFSKTEVTNLEQKIAEFWDELENSAVKCGLCPHYCKIDSGYAGKCGARVNVDGILIAKNYGCVTSIALDPIEKKPLYDFHPGKKIVSIGSYGCNLKCQFCQNYNISMEYKNAQIENYSPELIGEVAVLAIQDNNIGIAYTYNEPLIGYEYIIDCSAMIRSSGLMNVLVTNGYINQKPLAKLLPGIDAMNIDLKGFSEGTYNRVGGTLSPVKEAILMASDACHVEVTTLVICDENAGEIEEIAKWLASIDPNIPYHLSRFFPRYKYSDKQPTPPDLMYGLYNKARRYLNNVYIGNM
jgi:pyruvate formate lyase activating enzyme